MLDTNVWAYVADQGGADELRLVARTHDLDVLVSPAVVFEQLRLTNRAIRKRQLEVTTRQWWTRLMPEAFMESHELVRALRIHRPGWISEQPATDVLANFFRNRADWEHGFWKRARRQPDAQARANDRLGGSRIAGARRDVEEKKSVAREDRLRVENLLHRWDQLTLEVAVGSRVVRAQSWRVGAADRFQHELLSSRPGRRTYRDWLDPFIDRRLLRDQNAWLDFWLEVEPIEVPTQWLWWAASVLVPLVKVNQGTVFDVQLAGYLSASDVFITADRNLHRVTEAIAASAPFPIARPVLTTPDGWLSSLASLP